MLTQRVIPFASHFLESWYAGNILMQFAINDVFDKYPNWGIQFRKGDYSFSTSKEFSRCFENLYFVKNNTWDDAFSIDQAEADHRFASGDAAMYITGTWSLQAFSNFKPDFNIGIFPFPNHEGNARLIIEPNLTFMINAKSKNLPLINNIINKILQNNDLAVQIHASTNASTLLVNYTNEEPILIQDDIKQFEMQKLTVDATAANNQLIWAYQESLAVSLNDWLQGKTNLKSVLALADQNRKLSAP